jgi:hypothetical protein
MKTELDRWLQETEARFPINNENFSDEDFAKQKIRIREKDKPKLEREHANFLNDDYVPNQGWWEETGK